MSDFHDKDRLIVALDVPSAAEAEQLIEKIGSAAGFYKIGYQLAPVGGFKLAEALSANGKKVFLDLKYHDIGATVEKGVKSVRQVGADLLTVHAERDVVKAAVEGRGDDPRLKIMAVTVLTSLGQADIEAAGFSMKLEDLVIKRAELAAECGADGVIASAHEAARIRERLGDQLLIVTPGVRPSGASVDDQKRVVTPAAARAAGADAVVVGRPITQAADPASVAAAIAAELSETN
ncbi:MAG: orotidine-5'-phosphate decarboxylase [Pseudomonadota bacterium]